MQANKGGLISLQILLGIDKAEHSTFYLYIKEAIFKNDGSLLALYLMKLYFQ